ncbi:MAG: hypothetical protein ACXWQR_14185 [Ktedonobacterales bacterium]
MAYDRRHKARGRYGTTVSGFHKDLLGPDAKERRCLRCREMFMSEWVGNRMCESCKTTNVVHGQSRLHPADDDIRG